MGELPLYHKREQSQPFLGSSPYDKNHPPSILGDGFLSFEACCCVYLNHVIAQYQIITYTKLTMSFMKR